jgi:nitrogen fixation protein NifU and related proteins
MAYSEKVIDHYENPRNVGKMDTGDVNVGTGMVGAPACGDVMKLQIRVKMESYKMQNSRLTVADRLLRRVRLLVTEWVKGKTLEQAGSIKNTQIAEELALTAG